jgi:hypothetical protein
MYHEELNTKIDMSPALSNVKKIMPRNNQFKQTEGKGSFFSTQKLQNSSAKFSGRATAEVSQFDHFA